MSCKPDPTPADHLCGERMTFVCCMTEGGEFWRCACGRGWIKVGETFYDPTEGTHRVALAGRL
jgi:hypothetical protein